MIVFTGIVLASFLMGHPVLPGFPLQQGDSIKKKEVPEKLTKLVEQVKKAAVQAGDVEMELDGLLVDNTKTKGGKDFYDLFYASWEAPLNARNFTITVSEKPYRFTTTFVVVMINENVVYEAVLQPRLDVIEYMTAEAVQMAQSYLINYEEISRELNGDDLSGSGIF